MSNLEKQTRSKLRKLSLRAYEELKSDRIESRVMVKFIIFEPKNTTKFAL